VNAVPVPQLICQVRLCRSDVRKGSAFPISTVMTTQRRGSASPLHEKKKKVVCPESRRLSAHQAAKPRGDVGP